MGKSKRSVSGDFDGAIGISERFAVLNRLITRDLNNNTNTPTFSLYTKDNITEYLSNPYTYERQLRPCCNLYLRRKLTLQTAHPVFHWPF